MTEGPALELEGLERRYGERFALRGVSVRVEPGRTLAVFGANGAGKTTLLRVLAGLLRPHGGRARVLGAELPGERWRLHGTGGLPGSRPTALPRPERAREPPLPRAAPLAARLRGSRSCSPPWGWTRRADEPAARALARAWCSGWRWRVRCSTTRRCCCWTSRAPTSTPAAAERLEPLIGADSGRTRVLVTHDVEAAWPRPTWCSACRAGRQDFAGQADAGRVRELYA